MLVLIEDPKTQNKRACKPNKEEENAVDIPSKGFKPLVNLKKLNLYLAAKINPLITLLTEPTVPINP